METFLIFEAIMNECPRALQDIFTGSNIRNTIVSLVSSATAQVAKRVGLDSGFLQEE